MNHADIDLLVTSFIQDKAESDVNHRVQTVVTRLLGDLFKAIEDLDLQPSEIWQGLEYLTDAGKANELGLLAAGLGLERFIDIRSDEAEAKLGLTGGTPRTIEGPLYVAGAPESIGFTRMDDGSESHLADPLILEGTVYGADGQPLQNAKVEIWHANTKGCYSYFDKSQSAFNLRRSIYTDANGHYRAQSIMPVGYACPPEGTTQALLDMLGRHGNRPAHIHYFISAPGHRKLTTQINIDGDEYLWDDFAFASREGLVPPVKDITDPAKVKENNLDRPYKNIVFDIRLLPDVEQAPASVVERRRAAA
ncbi:catechol 1,2-dioxygenase [Advenella sp. WQ 585]|uniref:catechol 1,2-dioxygenase n=1 Tax=Advenella mandrilli TaxID=2800330 RepID=A0ABS1EF08_9BURK|nr:catechol 1,2-dioxygenase [Advenella mandrilli]MBK1780537.1 catechol 1,2-dioxygenase [Advenella mandrilli]